MKADAPLTLAEQALAKALAAALVQEIRREEQRPKEAA